MQVTPVRSAARTRNATFRTKVNLLSSTSQVRVDRIQRLNANPRSRAAAAHLLDRGAREIVNIAIGIAHQEFKPRSGARRPRPGSRHYVTSFFIEPATQDSIGRMIVKFGNSHAAAHIIENGADPHLIEPRRRVAKFEGRLVGPFAKQQGHLIFPFRMPSTRTQPGRGVTPGTVGDWPAEFGGDSVRVYANAVSHPGSPAFHIVARARRAYLEKNRLSRARRARL